MKQNKLGTAFKFSEPDTIHINREAWDERTYSFNSWNDKHILKDVDWTNLYIKTINKKGFIFMTELLLIIGMLALLVWSAL